MRIPFVGHYRTLNTVKISAAALRHNLNLYRKLCSGQSVCPVLKSNAYGHGLIEVAKVLDPEKPDFFIVDSLHEAYLLKKAGIKARILILGYTFPENLTRKKLPFHFTVSDLESAEALSKQKAKIHLKIDTGMHRMGFLLEELPEVLDRIGELDVEVVGVLTHLADADNPNDGAYTEEQLERFKEAVDLVRKAGFDPQWIHAGQSAGGPKAKWDDLNMIRLGFSLYGISVYRKNDPMFEALFDLKPVMQLESTLVGIRHLKKGNKVSYSCTFTADRDMTVGTVPVGYYEALPWGLSGKGSLEVGGVECPVLGRICMNYTTIDLSDVPNPKIGDRVVVISSDAKKANSIAHLAQLAEGTFDYEMMTRVSGSIRREVVDL